MKIRLFREGSVLTSESHMEDRKQNLFSKRAVFPADIVQNNLEFIKLKKKLTSRKSFLSHTGH